MPFTGIKSKNRSKTIWQLVNFAVQNLNFNYRGIVKKKKKKMCNKKLHASEENICSHARNKKIGNKLSDKLFL